MRPACGRPRISSGAGARGMTRVGFIGTGHIAAPMARALARKGHTVTVSERNAETAAGLVNASLGITVASNQGVIDASDIVFLCLRPALWADALQGLTWRADQQIVSASTPNYILSVSTDHDIVTASAIEIIITGSAAQYVVAASSLDVVIAEPSEHKL